MGAHRHKQAKNEKRNGSVFELPAGARVARRGSTRVEPRAPAEHAYSGRGRSARDEDGSET
jgi:hypothetical protein